MPRQQRSNKTVAEIANRFMSAMEKHLGLAPTQLWRLLGYSNPSTLQAVRRGSVLPDFVRVAQHKELLRDSRGLSLNLHWVITGEGAPLLEKIQQPLQKKSKIEVLDDDIIIMMRCMKPGKKAALKKFLAEFR